MKTVVARVHRRYPIVVKEIDISGRPDLEREFGNDIPVLLNGHQIIARHRISASQLTAAIVSPSGINRRHEKKTDDEPLSAHHPP